MAKKRVEDCRTWKDFHRYAKKHADRWEEAGSHTKYYGPGGQTVLSRGSGEPSKGLRSSIIKQIKLIGIAVIILAALIVLP